MTTTPLLLDHSSDSPKSFILLSFDHLRSFTQLFCPPLSFILLYSDHPQSCLVCCDHLRSFLLLCFDHLQSFLLLLSIAVFYFHKYIHLTEPGIFFLLLLIRMTYVRICNPFHNLKKHHQSSRTHH